MLQDIVFILAGLLGLYYGSEWLVSGSSRTALRFNIPPVVIGLTIVAVGTSMPELVVSILAAIQGNSEIALGNVIGSNIANIGLILGLTGLIGVITVKDTLVKREIPIMIFVSLLATLMIFDGELSRLDGIILVFGFVGFNFFFYAVAKNEGKVLEEEVLHDMGEDIPEKKPINAGFEALKIIVGLAVLVVGAQGLVMGATSIARSFGVSELVIGLTMVAVGTSLPELATSITAALKKENDIAVGNVVGSNIANLLLILGGTAAITPIDVSATALTVVEYGVMIGFAVILIPFTLNGKLGRVESAVFVGAYIAFLIYSFTAGNVSVS